MGVFAGMAAGKDDHNTSDFANYFEREYAMRPKAKRRSVNFTKLTKYLRQFQTMRSKADQNYSCLSRKVLLDKT